MKKIILYGNTEFTKLMKFYIEETTNRIIEAVTVEKEFIKSSSFENLPVIEFENIELQYKPSEYEILLCIGYKNMNTVRERIFNLVKEKGYSLTSYIHPTAVLAKNVNLGEGNIILENTVIQPFVKMGNCNLVWHNVSIAHNNNIGNYNTITAMSSINGFVNIGNNCFLGSNSTIRNNININDFSLIGAGAYVSKDTELNSTIVPNRSIKLDINSLDINI